MTEDAALGRVWWQTDALYRRAAARRALVEQRSRGRQPRLWTLRSTAEAIWGPLGPGWCAGD